MENARAAVHRIVEVKSCDRMKASKSDARLGRASGFVKNNSNQALQVGTSRPALPTESSAIGITTHLARK
jgi:hypothetical protein